MKSLDSIQSVRKFFQDAWNPYLELAPAAAQVLSLLESRNEAIINDHVAIRTFDLPQMGVLALGKIFEKLGYVQNPEPMFFPEKKLRAFYWQHPNSDLPKVFISELLLDQVEPTLREFILATISPSLPRLSAQIANQDLFALLEPSWNTPHHSEIERLAHSSEYAFWTLCFGLRINHYTVSWNALKTFASLGELNALLLENGIDLNSSGGLIKGSPNEYLEQSSTVAQKVLWKFAGNEEHLVPGCYTEFARRYPLPSGELFHGFVPKSADRIFESTQKRLD
jgi:hypothetical protein